MAFAVLQHGDNGFTKDFADVKASFASAALRQRVNFTRQPDCIGGWRSLLHVAESGRSGEVWEIQDR